MLLAFMSSRLHTTGAKVSIYFSQLLLDIIVFSCIRDTKQHLF